MFDIAGVVQALAERYQSVRIRPGRKTVKEADHRKLLRAGPGRPRRCRATEQRDELAPSHVEHGASSPPRCDSTSNHDKQQTTAARSSFAIYSASRRAA